MIRQLAVTVFVLSFAALGCGSDEGTEKKDSSPAEVGRSETGAGPEAQPMIGEAGKDLPPGSEAGQLDAPGGVDVPAAEVKLPVDTGKLDGGSVDTITQTDVQAPDAPSVDVAAPMDAGVDAGSTD